MWLSMSEKPRPDFDFTEQVLNAIEADCLTPVVLTGTLTPPGMFNGTCRVAILSGVAGSEAVEVWVGGKLNADFGFEILRNGTCIPERGRELLHHRKKEVADYLEIRIAGGNILTWEEWWNVRYVET